MTHASPNNAKALMHDPILAFPHDMPTAMAGMILAEDGAGAMLVIDRRGRAVGSVSLADIVRQASHAPLKDVMDPQIARVSPETSLDGLVAIFRERPLETVFVFHDDQPVGFITVHDVLSAMAGAGRPPRHGSIPPAASDDEDGWDLGVGHPFAAWVNSN